MSLLVSSLVPFLRPMINDNDPSHDYDYSDQELIDDLVVIVAIENGAWEQGYSLVKVNGESAITPDPPQWMQMLYVLRTAIAKKGWVPAYSYKNNAVSITRTSKTEDLKVLQDMYDAILHEHRYTGGEQVYSTWDDFFNRFDLIWDKVNEEIGAWN